MTDTDTLRRPVAPGVADANGRAHGPDPVGDRQPSPLDPWGYELEQPNPLRDERAERTPAPCSMVIFGVSGDLTARKLMPALYDLAVGQPLPEGFSIVGVSHRDWDEATFKAKMREAVAAHARTPVTAESWEPFARGLFYVRGEFDDPATFATVAAALDRIDRDRRTLGNRLFYLATAPQFFSPIVGGLSEAAALERQANYQGPTEGWHRLVIEKPIGHDLASAQELIAEMSLLLTERQIYRIDHYLGKETVQNVLAFRFANSLFDPVWNRQYVDNVQITAAEALGVEGRSGYYEHAGALRDMVESHLLQLLTVVAMEPPAFFNGDAVRDEKVKVLRSTVPPTGAAVAAHAVRGQYATGYSGGRPVPAYHEEKGVSPDSQTETYVALRLGIDNWRWSGVPFYLRTGKRLPRRVTEIAVEFKQVPHQMFGSIGQLDPTPNVISLRIQPDEGIALRFAAKVPGARTQLRTVRMDFLYGAAFGEAGPDAYERLLLDAMLGDPTLFTRRDEVEAAWSIVQPVLDAWAEPGAAGPAPYDAGTWGPDVADAMIARDGRAWRRP
ncbi:MAG: Glucose-6-phosphate 1-dehydrogenase [uncultured Thermomicrobiales bacterium]|uniref:Glucose-6-phosphate 1-dehydrogenase n=1 Tax=uncultured Thermomicrobiales bacterium TaxID=1645740 RepID=A0A6J4VJM1_9BACT|nr:MAG: Glucose-6-phosphate 1-dehydrogenase [uncultured Thermomicrobiales bacterium]